MNRSCMGILSRSGLGAQEEEERRRVAYEVHDGLAQTVSAAYQHLQNYAADNPPTSARGREGLDEALEMLRRTVGEARAVVADLRPTVLDDFGLARALRLQVERLSEEGLRATFEEDLGGERLPGAVETALFGVDQEALTNVRKHSQGRVVGLPRGGARRRAGRRSAARIGCDHAHSVEGLRDRRRVTLRTCVAPGG